VVKMTAGTAIQLPMPPFAIAPAPTESIDTLTPSATSINSTSNQRHPGSGRATVVNRVFLLEIRTRGDYAARPERRAA
jgi:hypothetical protein